MRDDLLKCSHCGNELPKSSFHKASNTARGYDYRCKPCAKDYKKEFWEDNKEYLYQRAEEYRNSNRDKSLLYAAKDRAKRDKLPFNIDMSDVVIPETYPILGIPLKFNSGRVMDDSPSIDKIVPSLGYIKGNICVISARANRIKCNASIYELRKIADWMEEKLRDKTSGHSGHSM